jgi:monoamine oxidase
MPTKREFLFGIAKAGGVSATFLGMQALGLAVAQADDEAFSLQPSEPQGTKVVILGGGISGLVSAWELGKAGYDCVVLEARRRVGGRNWSIRNGDRIEMTDGSAQDCKFDPGLYWNAGPARLPSIHTRILGYCHEMGVKLEVEVNAARAARLYNPNALGGRAVEMRQAVNDTRGAVSELLAKAINRGALDEEIGRDDRERVYAFLKQYGDLTPEQLYKGSSRSGWQVEPSAGSMAGEAREPLPLRAFLDVDLWNGVIFEDIIDQQATMFQPVGGMDHIPKAFEARLGPRVRKGCEIKAIRRETSGVRVEYLDRQSGTRQSVQAQYCISTLPLVVLRNIQSDFSPSYQAAIRAVPYHESVKVAWQSRRFWEQNFGIHGGISWVKGPTNMVWYPSGDLFADQGVLVGAYASNEIGDEMSSKSLQAQFDLSRAMVEGLHPGYSHELQKPMAIAWKKVPFAEGAAPIQPDQTSAYQVLAQPDGPFYFAGDYLSHIGNWQEAALSSAQRTMVALDLHCRASRPVPISVTS